MKVWQCDDLRPVPGLVSAEVNTPQPGRGEVLIRVHAVGVTHTELLWQPTTHTRSGENRLHAIPGHELSGAIAAVGAGADGIVGQEVFGMNDWYAQGATAEFCCAPPSAIAPKPARLTHVEAASVPIDALTAWQGLFDRAQLQAGERVLIHGGAGAVGVFAIQLACRRGAHVLTTASGRDRDFLLRLGAQQVIDYHTERFDDVARDVDVVFDAVGSSTLHAPGACWVPAEDSSPLSAPSNRPMMNARSRPCFLSNPIGGSSATSRRCWTPANCGPSWAPCFHSLKRRQRTRVNRCAIAVPARQSSR